MEFCEGPKTYFLAPLLEEAMAYRFDEAPNYCKLKFLMKKLLIENNIKPAPSFVFDQQLWDYGADSEAEAGDDADEGRSRHDIYRMKANRN